MSEMIDRVAKAIDEVLGDDFESYELEMGFPAAAAKSDRKSEMRIAALAALQVLREPTQEMLDAVRAAGVSVGDEFVYQRTARETWQSMIDEALKEN